MDLQGTLSGDEGSDDAKKLREVPDEVLGYQGLIQAYPVVDSRRISHREDSKVEDRRGFPATKEGVVVQGVATTVTQEELR